MNNSYAKAYTEVLEIISYLSKEEYSRIPQEKISFYEKNKDKTYEFKINPKIELSEQNISKEANAIIITLFRDYFATEKQKEKLEKILVKNEKNAEEEKKEAYNPEHLFKNKIPKKDNTVKENNLPVEIKSSNFFTRFINYIKSLFIRTN